MAGDWIKMRDNLWDDPRVASLVDATDSSEAAVIGALYWLWSTADQHSENGLMPGLTTKAIDRKTGVAGIGAALIAIGWLEDGPDGVRIPRFDEHNGASAKRRSLDAQRKATVRSVSASHADNSQTDDGQTEDEKTTPCGARVREEKRKEDIPRARRAVPKKTAIPDCFALSDRVRQWAEAKGVERLDEHLEAFVTACKARGYTYADWDAAFMTAVRDDWAKLGAKTAPKAPPKIVDGVDRSTWPEWMQNAL